jgi:His-Xaa-Ser system radical SAM maturase HxsC
MQRLHSQGEPANVAQPVVGKLTTVPVTDRRVRMDYIIDGRSHAWAAFCADPDGYAGVLVPGEVEHPSTLPLPSVRQVPQLEYLSEGDVVALQPSGRVNVLYRRRSRHNTILTTERCNSLCLMCSQPPKADDDSYRVGQILRLLELIDPDCHEICFSGGEPALLGDDFLGIIAKSAMRLPKTAVHVLTNGRLFKNREFARRLGAVQHPDLMLGIPLYSDIDQQHDYVVQAQGAYEETLEGFYNLAEAGVPIELRVVLQRQTYERLPQLAEFIYRNLTFVAQVVFMGMEMFGLVHQNLDALWIDPADYQEQLERATLALARRGMTVRLYNHQLCVLRRRLWPFAVQSISDWKNTYLPECEACSVRNRCAGFFQSGIKRHSAHIAPILRAESLTV